MKTILIQFDTDPHPSSFDRIVAVDAGADEHFSYGGMTPANVTDLVHGAIFTRGPKDLHNTAIFVGGSNVQAGEALYEAVGRAFFGPMKVSVMMDSNGCNTTASAAVVAAKAQLDLKGASAIVLGGTGPVGQRAAELLAMEGCDVTVVSRSVDRATAVCKNVEATNVAGHLNPAAASSPEDVMAACADKQVLIAAGAAGICFLPKGSLTDLPDLRIAIDLNAVPPLGLADVGVADKAQSIGDTIVYGALGVGTTKMKVHKQAIARLFKTNDATLSTREIYQIALEVAGQ